MMDSLKRAVREKKQTDRLVRGGRSGLRTVAAQDPPRSTRGVVIQATHLTTHEGVGTEEEAALWGVHTWGEGTYG